MLFLWAYEPSSGAKFMEVGLNFSLHQVGAVECLQKTSCGRLGGGGRLKEEMKIRAP